MRHLKPVLIAATTILTLMTCFWWVISTPGPTPAHPVDAESLDRLIQQGSIESLSVRGLHLYARLASTEVAKFQTRELVLREPVPLRFLQSWRQGPLAPPNGFFGALSDLPSPAVFAEFENQLTPMSTSAAPPWADQVLMVTLGPLLAGEIRWETTTVRHSQMGELWQVRLHANSSPQIGSIYQLRDLATVWLKKKDLTPVAERYIFNETDQVGSLWLVWGHELQSHRMTFHRKRPPREEHQTFPANTMGLVSLFFLASQVSPPWRGPLLDLEESHDVEITGDSGSLGVVVDGQILPLEMRRLSSQPVQWESLRFQAPIGSIEAK